MLSQKLKAGALQITLFIVVIIALLLAAFLVFVQTNKQFNIHTDFVIKTYQNTNRGFNYNLLNETVIYDTTALDRVNQDHEIIKTYRGFWGVFEKVTVTSKINTLSTQKTALIGSKHLELNRTALYLQDNNKPLVLVGQTKIQGLCYLPEKGVKAGNISGESYYSSQLIYGNTKQSSVLPALNTNLLNHIEGMSNDAIHFSNNQYFQLKDGQVVSNSFLKSTLIHFDTKAIDLINVKLTGNIIIKSASKITVYPSSKLTDVILIAPEIEIKANTIGVMQAMASRSIKVNENCTLKYPSALVLSETVIVPNQPSRKSSIEMKEGTKITGSVLYINNIIDNNHQANVIIHPKVNIKGEVYCNGNLELRGSVFGSVYTNNFVVKKSGSIYQNHIYHGNISIDALEEEFVGLSFTNSKKEILKWLY